MFLGGLFVREVLAAAAKSIIYVAQFGFPLKSQGLCYESPLIGGVFDAGEKISDKMAYIGRIFNLPPVR